MTNKLEKDIQREICEWLQGHNYFFWRMNNVPIFGRSNDGVKRFRAMPKFTPRGLPDIIVINFGKVIGIEVKRPGGKVSEDQLAIAKQFIANGGQYFVAECVEDVIKQFKI